MTLGLVEVEEVCRLLLLLLLLVNLHLTINQGLLGVPIGLEIKVELLLLLFLIILLLSRLSNLRNCSLIKSQQNTMLAFSSKLKKMMLYI